MMAENVNAIESVGLASIVREAWDEGDDSIKAATDALVARVTNDEELLARIMPQVLRAWCNEQVRDLAGSMRLRAAASVGFDQTQRGGRLASVIASTLFDFPLPGGKRLGDANADEVRIGAQAYQTTADDAAHKARWLAQVAGRVGRKNSVEAALTLQQLEAIYEDARHGE